MNALTEIANLTPVEAIAQQQEMNARAHSEIWEALSYHHTDNEIATLLQYMRQNNGDLLQIALFERVARTRELMRVDPTYFRMGTYLRLHSLVQLDRPDPRAILSLADEICAMVTPVGKYPVDPILRLMPWGSKEAAQWRQERKWAWPLPHLIRVVPRGSDETTRRVMMVGLGMLGPSQPEYRDVMVKLQELFQKGLTVLLDDLDKLPLANVGEAMLKIGRLFRGARVKTRAVLEKEYLPVDMLRWRERAAEGEESGRVYLLFELSPNELLLLENNEMGQRAHGVLEKVRRTTADFWAGAHDVNLKRAMLAQVAAFSANTVQADAMLQRGADAVGFSLVRRERWNDHDDVWLLLRRGFDARVSILLMSPASAVRDMCTEELHGFNPRYWWHEDMLPKLMDFRHESEQIFPDVVSALETRMAPAILAAPAVQETEEEKAVRMQGMFGGTVQIGKQRRKNAPKKKTK